MRNLNRPLGAVLLLVIAVGMLGGCGTTGTAEDVRIATYNVENWRRHFNHHKFTRLEPASTQPSAPAMDDLLWSLRSSNREDNWEVSLVVKDMDADVLLIQEGPGQSDLEYFNREWLDGMYETVQVFKTNTTRVQTLAVMLKPGFKVLETVETYDVPDRNDANPRSDKLFARGPAFVHVETPAGRRFWAGTTHQKSKSGNSLEATQWRIAEGEATYGIMIDLQERTGDGVLLAGDMNDSLGMDEYETELGIDAIETLDGPGTVLITRELAEAGAVTFGGYSSPRYRSFIDHAVVTNDLAEAVGDVSVYTEPMSKVASDHYPVVVTLRF
ncbi:MAG: endonuclease/exonuclease/phosphatase family protein [Phycisphaerae bacterium]